MGQHKGADVIYTAPAQADLITTDEHFAEFKTHMDPYQQRPWIWIFDCRGMTSAHYTNIRFCRALYKVLTTEHKESLQAVWILNINTWMRAVLSLFHLTKVSVLPAERLELFVTMQRAGLADGLIDELLNLLHVSEKRTGPNAAVSTS